MNTTEHLPSRTDDQPPSLAGDPPSSRPRAGGRMTLVVVVAVVSVVAVLLRPGGRLREEESPTYLTEPVRIGTLSDTVEADVAVAFGDDAIRTIASPRPGTLTAVGWTRDAAPERLGTVAEVDGVPLTYVPSDVPLYRDLADGVEGPDVQSFEQALDDAGYDPGTVDESFTAETADAVRTWQADTGLVETGTLPVSEVVSFPAGMTVVGEPAAVGDAVAVGQPLLGVADLDDLVVTAAIDPAEVSAVAVGDPVNVDLDGFDEGLVGTVVDVPRVVGEDGTFAVRIDLEELPDGLRVGVTGSAEIAIETRTDVVVIPVAALESSGAATTVEVLVDGEPTSRDIDTGLVTTDGIEVTEGLDVGEELVIGVEDVEGDGS